VGYGGDWGPSPRPASSSSTSSREQPAGNSKDNEQEKVQILNFRFSLLLESVCPSTVIVCRRDSFRSDSCLSVDGPPPATRGSDVLAGDFYLPRHVAPLQREFATTDSLHLREDTRLPPRASTYTNSYTTDHPCHGLRLKIVLHQ
jgi:hypothetical protein